MNLKLMEYAGTFAQNKDVAQELRLKQLIPTLEKGEGVVLDFEGIEGVTQSFVHALISDLFRKFGAEVLDKIEFKNCAINVQKIILMVSDYMQEAI